MVSNQGNHQADTPASLELLYQISSEIASTIHLPTLIERILSLSIKNIGVKNGSIFVLDETGKIITSTLIINNEPIQVSPQEMQATMDSGLAGWVLRNREAALIADTSQDQRWLQRPDDALDASGPKSVLCIPFLARDQVVGVITLVHSQTHFFKSDHHTLIQAIADQSAIAVLNARFHANTMRTAQVMTSLSESAAAITGSLNLGEVLNRILEQVSLVFETEAVSLALVDDTRHFLTFRASTIKGTQSPVGVNFPFGAGIAGWVAANQTGIIVPGASQDDRINLDIDRQIINRTDVIACVPIFSEGEVIGVVEVIDPNLSEYESDDLRVLQGISSLAGTAIRQAKLFNTVKETHKRYFDLFEGNISGIILTDLSGKILEVNKQAASLSGYSKAELAGMDISRLQTLENDALADSYLKLSEGKKVAYESYLFTRDEAEVPISLNVKQVSVRGDTYLQWELHDITERKALDQLREELLSMIYHDLRSPLANIISSLDLMSSLVDFNKIVPEFESLLGIAQRSTRRIQRLTASLLDINRLEAGYPIIDLEPSDFETIIQDCIQEVQPTLSHKELELDVQINEKLPKFLINVDMIQRVLINLLENAMRFTSSPGQIVVSAKVLKKDLQVSVIDQGPGIPHSNLHNIFEKFTRLPGGESQKGYGLGLAFCRLAVEAHGGRIWAENMPESGACFTFTLPLE